MREEWRPIAGFSRYEASNLGRVRRRRDGRVKAPEDTGTMLRVNVVRDDGQRGSRNVGALVLRAFKGPPPPGHQCSHLNGDYRDNGLGNLAWETALQNIRRKAEHGTQNRGESHGRAKLTEGGVRQIREMVASGATPREIAVRFGVHESNIRRAVLGKSWSHVA